MDLNAFASLLASGNESFITIEAKFKKTFDIAYYPSICSIICDLASDGFTGSIGSQVEALVCVYLCHVMTGAYPDASGSLATCLQQLDKHIRDDARRLEQLKYRQTAKDFKKYARDALDADGYRCRTAIKCFAFQCILGQMDCNSTPSKVLKQAQSVLDTMLESWSTVPGPLEDRLKELASADRSTLASNTIVSSATVPAATPAFCRASPLESQLFTGEMHYILGPESHWVHFDHNAHPSELAALKRLVVLATQQVLSTQDRQDLLQRSARAHQIGLTPTIIVIIATHDPEVAAVLLSKSAFPSRYLQRLLDELDRGALTLIQFNTIALHCGKCFDPVLAGKYIQISAERILKTNDSSAMALFASTLHELTVKNRDFALPENKKEDLKGLFATYSTLEEVSSLWSDFK